MADEDPRYTKWLKLQPCRKCKSHNGVDAHHRMGAGMGLRSHDHDAISLCRSCHAAAHAYSGPFEGWDRVRMRGWHDRQAQVQRVLYAQHDEAVPA